MKKEIKELINSYWKFDEFQHPTSSWHDKQDLLDKIDELFNSSGHDEVQAIRQNEPQRKDCSTCVAGPMMPQYEPCLSCINFSKWTQSD